tara:strand:- start:180 stop:467 length:288 start_codon:yes stop_codon:yes gene_type:complete
MKQQPQRISLRVLKDIVVFEPHEDMLVIAVPWGDNTVALLRELGGELIQRAEALAKMVEGEKYRKPEREPTLPRTPHTIPDVHVHLPLRGGLSDG